MSSSNKDKSSNSSFEDLSNLNENDLREADAAAVSADDTAPETVDIIGNGQLTKKILVKGGGYVQPKRGDICRISYVGRLDNGTIVESKQNIEVQNGDVEIVQGLDMAVPLMLVGEKAEVFCDPRFAYGTIGLVNEEDESKSIPPGANITYEIELHECDEEIEVAEQQFEKRRDTGVSKRERGNFWYSRGEYGLAIQLYRRSLDYLNDNGPGVEINEEHEMTNAQLQELLEVRIKVYNNLAAAQMKISAFDTALKSVDQVLRCQPENVKALFRKGKILESMGDANAAIPVLQKGATLDPDSKAIQQLLSKCIMKSRRDARNEKDFYKKMMGQAQKIDSPKQSLNDSGHEVPKLKLWSFLMGSILIGVAGVAIYRYKYF